MSITISDLAFRPTSMAGRPYNGYTTVAPNYELLRSGVVVDVVQACFQGYPESAVCVLTHWRLDAKHEPQTRCVPIVSEFLGRFDAVACNRISAFMGSIRRLSLPLSLSLPLLLPLPLSVPLPLPLPLSQTSRAHAKQMHFLEHPV